MSKATAILDAIFADGHEPARGIGRGMYAEGHAVVFPTTKVPSGVVRARSPLMADGLLHLDTDPEVIQIAPYPLQVEYWSTHDEVNRAKREHVADMAILLRDARIVFIDYISVFEQEHTPFFRRRVAERLRHFRNELGCDYAVHDERSIRIEPRLSNLRLMWTHRQRRTEPSSLALAREALRQARLPTTIRSVADDVDLSRQAIRWSEEERPVALDEPNLIFTAVMQLAMRGEVRLDLGKPLTIDAMIYGAER